MEAEYDYLVVGGGTAGVIVAARLAEEGRSSVCLVEAGPSDEGNARVLEIGRWASLVGSELVRSFPVEAQERGNSRLVHSRAYVLGGCSSHNQGIAFPAPAGDLDTWERLGAAGWGPAGTSPFFEHVLERVNLETAPADNPCAAAFVEAALQAGFPLVSFDDPNLSEGVGRLRLNVRGPLRQSSSVAYLHEHGRKPADLTILTETAARRLRFADGRTVAAVETTRGDLRARREVILACGAIETPKLLLLSGVGPGEELATLGIPVVHDLPGVGRHLLDHPEGTAIWAASRAVPTGVSQDWEVALFARSVPALEQPDVMIHFGTMPADAASVPPGAPTAEHAFWLTPNVTRPRSEGRLRLRSPDPADPPLLDPRYFTDPDGYDERVLLAGMKLARRLAAQPALRTWAAAELVPGPGVEDDDALSGYARANGTTVHHPAGTCRIGRVDDPLAVVDPELRVLGLQGLRVADASVFPAMIGVNIGLTTMMVGEKCADLVRSS